MTISGNGLAGATAVEFAGAAAAFTVASDNEITTAVPAGATSGPIAVHTPSGVVASPSAFAVETSDGT